MCTLLDALIPALGAGVALGVGGGVEAVLTAMASGAAAGAEATKTMTAMAGRASYVPVSQVQGTPDPGAMFVAFVLGAVANMGDDI
jgi:dihydroxyacetone kinase